VTWFRALRAGRGFRPQTVAGTPAPAPLELDDELRTWLQFAYDPDEASREREEAALARLRVDPARSSRVLAEAYDRVDERSYDLRWALVYCAGSLNALAALPLLARVLEAEIPPERSDDVHHFSTRGEETSLRLQAVRGIAALASAGEDEARSLLLAQLAHPSYAVQVIALQELRGLPDRAPDDQELRGRLPADRAEQAMAIRQVSVDELGTLVPGTAITVSPRPPGGESGVDFDPSGAPRAGGADG
jgi:hypothetical protein